MKTICMALIVLISSGTFAQSVSTGLYHSLFLCGDGQVSGSGRNDNGQLGIGNTTNQFAPVVISGLDNIVKAEAGTGYFSVFLSSSGNVWFSGSNAYGNFGNGGTSSTNTVPVPGPLSGIVDIAAGFGHSVLLSADGSVYTSGWGNQGQLGSGSFNNSTTPVEVGGVSNIIQVDAGYWHTLMLRDDGTVWAAGSNNLGQLGMPSNVPYSNTAVQITGLPEIIAISAGSYYSLFLSADHEVYACGSNAHGQLGTGNYTTTYAPTLISGLPEIASIAAGNEHSFFRTANGDVWGVGFANFGQNGLGATTATPAQVTGLDNVISIAASGDGNFGHSLFLKSNGALWGCGANGTGQLGTTGVSFSTPTFLSALCGSFLPEASFTTDETEVCVLNDPCFVLNSTSVNADVLSWDFGGLTAPVENGQSFFEVCYGETGTFEITLTASNEFGSSTAMMTVTVHDAPDVTLTLDETLFCLNENPEPVVLSGGIPEGGFYSGPGVSDGIFDPAVAGIGEHQISYFYEITGFCSGSGSVFVEVANCVAPNVDFQLEAGQVCLLEPCINVFNLTTGATSFEWIIPGTEEGTSSDEFPIDFCFNEAGIHTIMLTASNEFGSASFTQTIEVFDVPEVTLSMEEDTLCLNLDPLPLVLSGGIPEGGTYSGEEVSDGIWTFADLAPGTYPITYTVVAFGACQASAVQEITLEICSGVTEQTSESAFRVLQDDRFDRITLQVNSGEWIGSQLSVINALGQIMVSDPTYTTSQQLDSSMWPGGTYIIRLTHPSGKSEAKAVLIAH